MLTKCLITYPRWYRNLSAAVLVANDFTGAIIGASLLEIDPGTGRRLSYVDVSRHLERTIREPFRSRVLRPSKFEGHRPTIRHGCRMALMVA
ncbi:MAG: hypothetical protein BECKG1743D_GA0114223_112503, partial [Candidatus Kentron sp. G]